MERIVDKNLCCTCTNKGYSDGNGDKSTPCDLCISGSYYIKTNLECNCIGCYDKNICNYKNK